ncbi:MAG TPA: hypothetical protein PKW95_04765 [bacterium]|nr:hypothetical protein [bacterium]
MEKLAIKLPIVFGVTGHRNIRHEDIPFLEKVVRRELKRATKKFRHCEIIVLSALAEGADRLVARVALAEGFRLIAPLPMPIDEYKKDFSTQESKDEFDSLLKQAAWHYVLPLVKDNTLENIKDKKKVYRKKQYAQLGAYIAQESHFLLALWDGIRLDLLGGTSFIVRYKLQEEKLTFPMPDSPLKMIEGGPVFHIMTPRQEMPLPAEKRKLFKLMKRYPTNWKAKKKGDTEGDNTVAVDEKAFRRQQCAAEKVYLKKLLCIDRFNHDIDLLNRKEPEKIETSKQSLINDLALRKKVRNECSLCFEYFAAADALAIQSRIKKDHLMKRIFQLAIAALVVLVVYQNFFLDSPLGYLLVATFLYMTLTAFLFHLWAKFKDKCEWKHLDYRALAEGLRVQFFWKVARITNLVTEHYLRKQNSELDWIRYAIRSVELLSRQDGGLAKGPRDDFDMRLIKEKWIEEQNKYFNHTVDKNKKFGNKMDCYVKAMMWGGLVLSAILLLLHLRFDIHILMNQVIGKSLIVLITLLFAGAGMGKAYLETMAVKEETKLYSYMYHLHNTAEEKLNDAPTDQAIQDKIIIELGSEALRENGDWLQLHRARPIEMRVGG